MHAGFSQAQAQPAETFWRRLLRPLLSSGASTPFYLFSAVPIQQALDELDAAFASVRVRHWLSCKTHPLPALLRWWREQGRGIEVVSDYELRLARRLGFPASQILVNGPAKHHWLRAHALSGLRVNFDSLAEVRALESQAARLDWSCGIRLHTKEEFDPETPQFPTQFGFTPAEAEPALARLRRRGVRMDTMHFHLRTNVASALIYERALTEAAGICRAAGFSPRYVDCGGGLPPPNVRSRGGRPLNAEFSLGAVARVYERTKRLFPDLEEFWLENGRWLSARSGVLVVSVLDAKDRPAMRSLICDGGRTLHALVSTWENHQLFSIPARRGPRRLTTLNGPTCMAFDQLARGEFPVGLRPGDRVVWMEAGAYHLPWETKFSHGTAAIFWHDGRVTKEVRPKQSFEAWNAALAAR
jgi:diaminopimelate decarboxylase